MRARLAKLKSFPFVRQSTLANNSTGSVALSCRTKWILAFPLLAVFFLSITGRPAVADVCTKDDNIVVNDGGCWNTLSPLEKHAIIRGIWVGLKSGQAATTLIGEGASFFGGKDWTSMPGSTTNGDIKEYFDRLYETPANRSITWSWAYLLAMMYARDDDSNDRLALLKFLREHGSLPLYGDVLQVIDEDHVSVATDVGTFNIKIAGVSGEGLSRAEKDRATSFLRGILSAQASGGSCAEATKRAVSLVYDFDIFGNDHELSANLRIYPYPPVCLGSRFVELTDIAGTNLTSLDLTYFLISNGLLKPDPYKEEKWPEDVVSWRSYRWVAKIAENKGLYHYGSNTIEAVDDVIRFGSELSAVSTSPALTEHQDLPGEEVSAKAGSGFLVSPTVVVTNAHVVAGCQSVSASAADRVPQKGRILSSDETNDLALIQFDSPFANSVPVRFGIGRPARVGEEIFVGGYPLSGLLASGLSVTNGVISNSAGIGDDIRMMQITAPVQPGNSGGPVLSKGGILVGVATSKLNAMAIAQATGDIPQNVNFAIKASVVRTMLDAYEIGYDVDDADLPQHGSVYDRLKQVSVFIQCS